MVVAEEKKLGRQNHNFEELTKFKLTRVDFASNLRSSKRYIAARYDSKSNIATMLHYHSVQNQYQNNLSLDA